jgi:hypothetical protein
MKGNKKSTLSDAFSLLSRRVGKQLCSDSFANELFLNTCGLTGAITQIVKLGTADITTTLNFDTGDLR